MTHPGDPPTSPGSGRSIYERLGLTPAPGAAPQRRPVPVAPPRAGRPVIRYLLAMLLFAAALAGILLYSPVDVGHRAPGFASGAAGEDERRMDTQDAQIKDLQMRVEVLEMKLRTLQELNGYRPIDEGRRAAPGGAPVRPSSTVP